MRLTALVDSPDHVCCRYRLRAFRSFLKRAGHALDLRPLPQSWWARWRLFRSLRGANVVLQRILLPRWQLALLRRAARYLLFDLDDAVFLRDSYSPRGLRCGRRLHRFATTVRQCDAVLAGNRFLAEQAARWAGAERVHRIPTYVDPSAYSPAEPTSAGDGVQLVWVGSASTLRGIERTGPLLEEIGRRVSGVRLKVICDRFPEFRHLPVVPCPWGEATEAREIAAGDVGISWMPDDDWS